MNRLCLAAVLVLGLVPNFSSAVDIKNPRPRYGPLGPTRYDAKCLPGDAIVMTYEVEGLMIDPKTKKVRYETVLELLDEKDKVLFKDPVSAEAAPQLGGTSMPGVLTVSTGNKPGKYQIRLTVNDKVSGTGKAFVYKYEVIPEAFGFIQVVTPTVGFPGMYHMSQFALVNMTLDAKTKKPDVEILFRILDDKGKPVSDPAKTLLPRDLPETSDLQKANVFLVEQPIYLNRVGTYRIEIVATDKLAKKDSKLSYPLTVLDVGAFAK